jgi:hypothetical protein
MFISEDIEHKDVVEMIKSENSMKMTLCHRDTTLIPLFEMDNIKIPAQISLREPISSSSNHQVQSDLENDSAGMTSNDPGDCSTEEHTDPLDIELNNNQFNQSNEAEKENHSEAIQESQEIRSEVDKSSDSDSIKNSSKSDISNPSSSFAEMDFTRMSLKDLKQSIRNKPSSRRGPSVSEINWQEQKSVFKEL